MMSINKQMDNRDFIRLITIKMDIRPFSFLLFLIKIINYGRRRPIFLFTYTYSYIACSRSSLSCIIGYCWRAKEKERRTRRDKRVYTRICICVCIYIYTYTNWEGERTYLTITQRSTYERARESFSLSSLLFSFVQE